MKLNKKLLSLISVGALGMVALTPVANAAESNATITFESPNQAPAILDPENPDSEEGATTEQRDEGVETNEVGVLTLDFVSNLDFGIQQLSPDVERYPAENDTMPFAQVTDVRGGTGDGWRLSASLSNFSLENETEDSLPGAFIHLNSPEAVATSDNYSEANMPETVNASLSSDGTVADITTADIGQGRGSWLTRWEDDDGNPENGNGNVVLEVPASVATPDEHSATITWTLYNTPGGSEVEDLTPEPVDGEPGTEETAL